MNMAEFDLNLLNRLASEIIEVMLKFKKENNFDLTKDMMVEILESAAQTIRTLEM